MNHRFIRDTVFYLHENPIYGYQLLLLGCSLQSTLFRTIHVISAAVSSEANPKTWIQWQVDNFGGDSRTH